MSKIEWTERSWNPIIGCAIVSPGCTNCYAMRMAHRLGQNPMTPNYAGLTRVVNDKPVWTGEIRLAGHDAITAPMKRKTPTTWFVNSMSDLFAEGVKADWLDQIFAVMAMSPAHTYQVLTKRPERMQAYLTDRDMPRRVWQHAFRLVSADMGHDGVSRWEDGLDKAFPLPNVWLGVSAEDQRRADERIPILLDTPAAIRWVSAEPLLGPLDLKAWLWTTVVKPATCGPTVITGTWSALRPSLDWVVLGGESGPNARPMHPEWARQPRDQCAAARVPFFFKQWGEWEPRETWEPGSRRQRAIMLDGTPVPDDIAPQDVGGHRFVRTGKKAAGRLLDGVQHDGMPG
ncbi:DUF5131 family protein [Brevundimonas phoenicis]|uniref:DUF5131 family protein n=1 Tax=unclassified Brevundimonas TaxID=2622653 RepID=UPI0039A3CC91